MAGTGLSGHNNPTSKLVQLRGISSLGPECDRVSRRRWLKDPVKRRVKSRFSSPLERDATNRERRTIPMRELNGSKKRST